MDGKGDLELAALQASHALEHRLDDVPLHAVEEVHPAPLQVLIHLRIQQHLEVLDVERRPLHPTATTRMTLNTHSGVSLVRDMTVLAFQTTAMLAASNSTDSGLDMLC